MEEMVLGILQRSASTVLPTFLMLAMLEIHRLLANAEARENSIEQIVSIHRTSHLPDRVETAAKRERQEFWRVVTFSVRTTFPQAIECDLDVVPTATLAWSQNGARERSDDLGDRQTELRQAIG